MTPGGASFLGREKCAGYGIARAISRSRSSSRRRAPPALADKDRIADEVAREWHPGYGERRLTGIWVCSQTNSDSKPRSSSARELADVDAVVGRKIENPPA